MYYNMTNKELLDAYNASAEYDETICDGDGGQWAVDGVGN